MLWLLRMNGPTIAAVAAVEADGKIHTSGTRSQRLIRPALWIRL